LNSIEICDSVGTTYPSTKCRNIIDPWFMHFLTSSLQVLILLKNILSFISIESIDIYLLGVQVFALPCLTKCRSTVDMQIHGKSS
jgi:hypothetical protein